MSQSGKRLTAGNDTVAGGSKGRCVSRATKGVVETLVVAGVGESVVELSLWSGSVGGGPDLDGDTGVGGDSLAVLAP